VIANFRNTPVFNWVSPRRTWSLSFLRAGRHNLCRLYMSGSGWFSTIVSLSSPTLLSLFMFAPSSSSLLLSYWPCTTGPLALRWRLWWRDTLDRRSGVIVALRMLLMWLLLTALLRIVLLRIVLLWWLISLRLIFLSVKALLLLIALLLITLRAL